ncbi:DNA topoisomerase IV subunit B [Spirochaeta cellobiosiphila]|uniref:DNA topoisomerase IV subunit B n=1 Tax=Spirochaeta cellobiosiphila TaxID=504483 RepID=UPI00040D50E3|nr:DNA topoisomerase IV subunit B [Spirochaeta cellobiosiphila]
MPKKEPVYDESKIKTLSSLEHIRLRSGMYIGRLGDGSNMDDGIYVLIKEVIDNSIDEFIMGYGDKIEVKLEDKTASIRDYGRGIPLGKIVECVSVINTGAKYNDDVFQFSVGLNGVGTKAVNALSSHFLVRAHRNGKFSEAYFQKGQLIKEDKGNTKEPDGTYIEFIPDEEIFKEYEFNNDFIDQRIWNYAYLNTGLRLYFNGSKYESKKGLYDLLNSEIGDDALYDFAYHKGEKIEFAFTHTNSYGEKHFSFVNGQYTSDGGTHLSAFREGILKGVNEFFKKNFGGVDVREGICGAISIKLQSPVFESQTKNKLGNTEIRTWIVNDTKEAVVDYLHKHQEENKLIYDKIINNEKLRKELNAVKKEAKEASKRIALKIPNLKDCKYHLQDGEKGLESMIFLTEGLSATGSMVSARNVYTQAIFSLRGKPQNVFSKKRAEIYKNEELFNMMMSFGIENEMENLRYGRIIIATDADHDGFHIRNLLLTFFLNYFEELIVAGRVYILETPLFRVRNKKVTRYCYSNKERDIAMKEISNNEVTRFKGLGEISPKEMGQFIGDNMRLVEVNIKSIKNIQETLSFYMGKNTPARRQYIMENLI